MATIDSKVDKADSRIATLESAILGKLTAFDERISSAELDLVRIDNSQEEILKVLGTNTDRIEALEATVVSQSLELKAMKVKILLATEKGIKNESYSRRSNIRISGVPETTKEDWGDMYKVVHENASERLQTRRVG